MNVQLSFAQNIPFPPNNLVGLSNAFLSFFPHNINGSISLLTVNLPHRISVSVSNNISYTFSLGFYSLTGSTLSLVNSLSATNSLGTTTANRSRTYYISFTNISATSNITPGTWFWGLLGSKSGLTTASADFSVCAVETGVLNPANAFPSVFIGGCMSVSTSALPGTYATSDLDITGHDAMNVPYIIISG